MPTEIHPFKDFIPVNIKYLILGSFTSKDAKKGVLYDWYYCNGRNQFWSIIEQVYNVSLPTTEEKKKLFNTLQIGITDIIRKCERIQFNSLDKSLRLIEFNPSIPRIISEDIDTIYFTSRFVERLFHKAYSNNICEPKKMKFVCLPSPSPRYAMLSKMDKVQIYRNLLPEIG